MSPRRSICLLLLSLFTLSRPAAAQSVPMTGEYIIVSGGPALRTWENLRVNQLQHDNWWGNFIRPARVRMTEIRNARPNVSITWLVYRPGYAARAAEEGRPLLSYIDSVQQKLGIKLIWFTSSAQLINHINAANSRSQKIIGFEYYGHSNRYAFLFDYSSDVMSASTSWLHERDLPKIRSSSFDANAFCQSWGCHTGESMSKVWRNTLGVPMLGAIGKTDYSPGERAILSPGGRWAR